MDAYSLASEKISPFFDSIDGIALAIAENIPGLGLPSPEFDADRALVLHSSTQINSYYQQHRVHSRRSFTNPEAVSNLVRDTLKQHYLITRDKAVTENLGRFRSANMAPLAEMQCTGDFDIIDGMQAHQEDTPLPHGEQLQAKGISWDFEFPERPRYPSARNASHFYHHSRDSGICLEQEEELDTKPEPSRPQLMRRDKFPADHVSAQEDKNHGDDELTNGIRSERFQRFHPKEQQDSTFSIQAAESEQFTERKKFTVIINKGRKLSLATFEESMKPNTRSGYPIPHNLRFRSQPTHPRQLFLDEPPNKQEYLPAINGPFRQSQDPLKEKRRKMYSFFHRYFQSGGSPIDQKEFPLIAEGLWHINREHASHLVRELDGIVRHQAHGGDQMCCIPILPRCVVRELPRAREESPERWFSTIDEAWANRPRKDGR